MLWNVLNIQNIQAYDKRQQGFIRKIIQSQQQCTFVMISDEIPRVVFMSVPRNGPSQNLRYFHFNDRTVGVLLDLFAVSKCNMLS
jgi:hypothetical protein